MNALNIVNGAIVMLGLPTIIGVAVYIGRKLQILDDLKKTIDKVKQDLNVVCNFLLKNSDRFDSKDIKSPTSVK